MWFNRSVSAVFLIVLMPLFIVIALCIWLDDYGPALFRQTRVGRNGRLFLLLKFRSMRVSNTGSEITVSGDHRVTRVGRVLRGLKLDELPQLWNVVRGEMALIGPRPDVPAYVELCDPTWQAVLETRPGITDLATLIYRNEEAVLAAGANPDEHYRTVILPRKLALNLHYMRTRSIWSDLKILVLTIRYSFWPRGFDAEKIQRQFKAEHI